MMIHTASLPLSHDLNVHKIYGSLGCRKSGLGKNRAYLAHVGLSSCATRQGFWSFQLLESLSGSVAPVSYRRNVFYCQSFLSPGRGHEAYIFKSTALILTRACDALGGNTLLFKLMPAVGILAFATWGLRPLLRLGQVSLFENGTDANSHKNSTRHLVVSYLQALLLWCGAILLCRALDPIILPSNASQAVKQRLLNFARSLSTVLAFACCLSSLIQQAQKFFVETNDSVDARNMGFNFAGKAIYTAVWVAAVSLFMELLGFSTQKWLTAGGLGTVLLTLVGREILTNFLSSMMIHATRPFVLNEWIQTKIDGCEVSGTVEHVGWWSPTILRGDDREAVHIPNHKFTGNIVRNLSQKAHWRIKTYLAISHLDFSKINSIVADMRKVLAKNPQIEQQRLHRRVFLDDIDPENQALKILISCFVKTTHYEEYQCVKEALLLDLLRVIRHHGARLATPIRTVQKMRMDSEIDSVGFPDVVYTQASTNHRLMLIEPAYKINGDDKVKPSANSGPNSAEKDSQRRVGSASDSAPERENGLVSIPDSKKDKAKAAQSSNIHGGSVLPASEPQKGDTKTDLSVGSNPEEKRKESNGLLRAQKDNSSDNAALSQLLEQPSTCNMEHGHEKREVKRDGYVSTSLEENIVLGVALEGSKRMLPIEDTDASVVLPHPNKAGADRNVRQSRWTKS